MRGKGARDWRGRVRRNSFRHGLAEAAGQGRKRGDRNELRSTCRRGAGQAAGTCSFTIRAGCHGARASRARRVYEGKMSSLPGEMWTLAQKGSRVAALRLAMGRGTI